MKRCLEKLADIQQKINTLLNPIGWELEESEIRNRQIYAQETYSNFTVVAGAFFTASVIITLHIWWVSK